MKKNLYIHLFMTFKMRPYEFLPYGIHWLNKYADAEIAAEQSWKKYKSKF